MALEKIGINFSLLCTPELCEAMDRASELLHREHDFPISFNVPVSLPPASAAS